MSTEITFIQEKTDGHLRIACIGELNLFFYDKVKEFLPQRFGITSVAYRTENNKIIVYFSITKGKGTKHKTLLIEIHENNLVFGIIKKPLPSKDFPLFQKVSRESFLDSIYLYLAKFESESS